MTFVSERGSQTDGEFKTRILKREIHDRIYKTANKLLRGT